MQRIAAGTGRIVLRLKDNSETVFSELSASYPLKLLSPKLQQQNVAVVYILNYGGGLVGGDHIRLSVSIQDGAILLILSQGSTKVFKTRIGRRAFVSSQSLMTGHITSQRMDVDVAPSSTLLLLPDPVTCFRSAKYNQIQTFRLASQSSAVLLDWITSGRRALGEAWAFHRYYSLNEVWVDGRRIARDAMLLEEQDDAASLPPRTLADKLAPYSCYATVILYGPVAESTLRHISQEYEAISVFKRALPPDILWSFSLLCEGKGGIVRVAGRETEDVRGWLGEALRPLQDVIGVDIYRKAFG